MAVRSDEQPTGDGPPPCSRCGRGYADVRLSLPSPAGGQVDRLCRAWLCNTCLADELAALNTPPRIDLARFFQCLTEARRRPATTGLPEMPPDTACPGCGLTYAELSSRGMVGCAACYVAFRPAVEHALAVLHGT